MTIDRAKARCRIDWLRKRRRHGRVIGNARKTSRLNNNRSDGMYSCDAAEYWRHAGRAGDERVGRAAGDRIINPPLAAGEIVTTGTLTLAHPVAPGETWTAGLTGVALEPLRVRFARATTAGGTSPGAD